MTSKDTNPKDAIGTKKWRQFTVVPFQVIWEVGVGMLEGALKYGRHNYRASGVRASVYVDAALGHIHQYWEGEDIDPDSTAHLHHITKAITSLTVLRDAMMNDFYVDDRPPKIKDMDSIRTQLQSAVEELFKEHADKVPHHYVHTEDGAPYRGGSAVRENFEGEHEVDARLNAYARERERLDEILNRVHEENRRDRSIGSMFESLFGSFPDGYSMKTERIGDLEVTTIAPDDHPWNASDADMEDEDILANASERLVFPHEMEVGRTYRAAKIHTGRDIEPDKGGVWRVVRKDEHTYGVKPGWRADHSGVKLAPSTQFVEVVDDLEQMRRQFDHAQSSASIVAPILGLSSHALALLDEWRMSEGNLPFGPDTPQTARALALRQWAIAKGIITA